MNRRVYADPDHGRESIIIKVNIKFVFGAVQDALDTQHPEPPVFFAGKKAIPAFSARAAYSRIRPFTA